MEETRRERKTDETRRERGRERKKIEGPVL